MPEPGDEDDTVFRERDPAETERRQRYRAEDIRELWTEVRKWRRWVHKLRNEVTVALMVGKRMEDLEKKLDARAEVTHTQLGVLNTGMNEVKTVRQDFSTYMQRLEVEKAATEAAKAERDRAETQARLVSEERAKERRVHRRWFWGIVFALLTVLVQFGLNAILKAL